MTKPLYTRELKKFGIRYAAKPQESSYLSGVVLVLDEGGRGFGYIKFSHFLEDAVGHALPYGVSKEHPAFLKLIHFTHRELWRLYAFYLDRSKGVLLIEYTSKPEWLRNVRRGE